MVTADRFSLQRVLDNRRHQWQPGEGDSSFERFPAYHVSRHKSPRLRQKRSIGTSDHLCGGIRYSIP